MRDMTLKLPRYFYLHMENLLVATSKLSLLSGGTVQPKNTHSCILQVTGQF